MELLQLLARAQCGITLGIHTRLSLSLQLGVNDLLLRAAEKSHCSSCTVGQLGLLHGMEPACFTLADTEHLWD